jgi:hypothetical protein
LTARTLRITAAIAAIFLLGGLVSVATARHAAKTKVTIHYTGDGFHGKLKSSKAKCIKNRKVKVIRKSNGQKLYSDISDRDGRWDTGNSGQVHGTFYAHTRRIPGCRGGTSESIHT